MKTIRILVIGGILAGVLGLVGCKTAPAEQNPPTTAPTAEASLGIEQKWGIRIIGIRRSAAGYMLDFRYRVLDPDKAMALMDRRAQPYLVHDKTGAKFLVPNSPKIGPLRQTGKRPVVGRNYFVFFANPGQYVRSGDNVTVIIGEFQAPNLTVE